MKKREYKFMSNKQKAEALRLYKAGWTYDDIGGQLDIDPSRVGQLARKEGLPLRGESRMLPPKQKAAVERWRKAHERQRIASAVGTPSK